MTGFLEKFIIWEYNKNHIFVLLGDSHNMKNKFGNKAVSSASIIGGDDKPTAFFIVGKSDLKRTLKQNIQKFL